MLGSIFFFFFFFSSRRRHTRSLCDWSSDVCSSDLADAGSEQRPVPGSMVSFEDVTRVGALEHLVHASLHDLEGFVVALCRHGIFLLPVGGIPIGIPGPAANTFDELTAHPVALDRQ